MDIPGQLFCHAHRVWAHKQLARVAAEGVPREAFGFLTVLVAASNGLEDDAEWKRVRIDERVRDTRPRIERALRAAGAKAIYINGGVEIAKHAWFPHADRVHAYLQGFLAKNFPGSRRKLSEWEASVVHGHYFVLAHDGTEWISRHKLRRWLDRETPQLVGV